MRQHSGTNRTNRKVKARVKRNPARKRWWDAREAKCAYLYQCRIWRRWNIAHEGHFVPRWSEARSPDRRRRRTHFPRIPSTSSSPSCLAENRDKKYTPNLKQGILRRSRLSNERRKKERGRKKQSTESLRNFFPSLRFTSRSRNARRVSFFFFSTWFLWTRQRLIFWNIQIGMRGTHSRAVSLRLPSIIHPPQIQATGFGRDASRYYANEWR